MIKNQLMHMTLKFDELVMMHDFVPFDLVLIVMEMSNR